MLTPEHWLWWGLGWLFMPRMCVGILLVTLTPYHDLGLILAVIGAFLDIMSS